MLTEISVKCACPCLPISTFDANMLTHILHTAALCFFKTSDSDYTRVNGWLLVESPANNDNVPLKLVSVLCTQCTAHKVLVSNLCFWFCEFFSLCKDMQVGSEHAFRGCFWLILRYVYTVHKNEGIK